MISKIRNFKLLEALFSLFKLVILNETTETHHNFSFETICIDLWLFWGFPEAKKRSKFDHIKATKNATIWFNSNESGLKKLLRSQNIHLIKKSHPKWISILLKLQITVFAIFSLNLHHFDNSFCFWEASKWSKINSNGLNKTLWCTSIVSLSKKLAFESTLIVLGSFCSALFAKKRSIKDQKKCLRSTTIHDIDTRALRI